MGKIINEIRIVLLHTLFSFISLPRFSSDETGKLVKLFIWASRIKNKFTRVFFYRTKATYLSALILSIIYCLSFFSLSSCSKDSGTNADNNGRYQYPSYINGYISISHSLYKACEDSSFNHYSKEFIAGDTIFASISEVLGPDWQAPEMGLNETAYIICSNGDTEKYIFDYSRPGCVTNIDGVSLRFSCIKTQSSSTITSNNNLIEVNENSVVIVTYYKSYWTGKIVTDTSYVFP